jgi:hypothetical protein
MGSEESREEEKDGGDGEDHLTYIIIASRDITITYAEISFRIALFLLED